MRRLAWELSPGARHRRPATGTLPEPVRPPVAKSGKRAAGDYEVDFRTQQFVGQRGKFAVIPPCVASLYDEVAALE